jgi:hypothetical protein
MGDVHRLLLEQGKEQALRGALDRGVVEAASAYLADEMAGLSVVFSGWCHAALPHKRLANDAIWALQSEHCTLFVEPGHKVGQDGMPSAVGVPYGSRARLMLIYLQTEALRTNSREVELGKSLRDWLRRMDIPYGGKSLREVREQADRLARCRLTFHLNSGGKAGLLNQNLLDEAMFVSDEADQGCLFVEHAKLSESYFNSLKRHPVPIEEAAIRSISNNSQAIDAYLWLAYRLHSLPRPIVVSWKALHVQFGNGYSRLDDFRRRFIDTLALALAVYPEAKIEIDTSGVRLFPSKPPVSPKAITARL